MACSSWEEFRELLYSWLVLTPFFCHKRVTWLKSDMMIRDWQLPVLLRGRYGCRKSVIKFFCWMTLTDLDFDPNSCYSRLDKLYKPLPLLQFRWDRLDSIEGTDLLCRFRFAFSLISHGDLVFLLFRNWIRICNTNLRLHCKLTWIADQQFQWVQFKRVEIPKASFFH